MFATAIGLGIGAVGGISVSFNNLGTGEPYVVKPHFMDRHESLAPSTLNVDPGFLTAPSFIFGANACTPANCYLLINFYTVFGCEPECAD